ncbi:MAG: hypothetical protein AB8G77_05845 [Rhodothermales bacterium]
MIPHSIRYRYAVLLLWAVLALVSNPVLHAIGHAHTDELVDPTEHVSDTTWSAEDLCPFCDAISHHVASANTEIAIPPAVFFAKLSVVSNAYPDLRLRLSTRLRAPPALV